ncbi:MAG: hypothetical protein COU81_03525 [Candidatus Portnoybacteria bacterium CG10_big_fil_rev_8_21_14_0_10_36_7]|uniref:TIGR00374 family protein n=1 Tax=Candidatus Portnoybacteria bacterium CG10_big_fil_rev_8_21_14_0_10_36_7 TaxID=1974812 RepID=A0A2M8KDB3_9BACT|nr:MAG: hypothetical protein COU81_03525 [Candidatus Portnoybacteria bacterium CG10_big_fil_rev_8_21_14_0_10_36_7]
MIGKKLIKFIGVIIVIIILSRLDFIMIAKTYKNANKFYLFIGLALTILSAFAKAVRWNYIKKTQKIYYSTKDSFVMYCASHLAGTITPGRIGELSKSIYLKNDGYSYGQSSFSVILDRLFDVIFLIFFAGLGMLFFGSFFYPEIPYVAVLIIIIITSAIIYKKKVITSGYFKKVFNAFAPIKYSEVWHKNILDFIKDLDNLKRRQYINAFAMTGVAWLIYYFQMYIFAQSLGIIIPFLFLAISVTIAGVLSMLPISYLGLGTRDLILITLFSYYSISKESTIAFSGIILMTYLIMAIVGLYCWTLKPPTKR